METKKPLTIAHRGGRNLWPENTLFALDSAGRAGFDGAEIDVQLCRDGALVLFHDFRLNPDICRDRDGHWLEPQQGRPLPLICEQTYPELATYDVGRTRPDTVYGRKFAPANPRDGEHIPRLADAIDTVRAANPAFRLLIEIKTAEGDRTLSAPPEAVAEAMVAELRHKRFMDNAILVGFDWPALIWARKLEPELACWFTTRLRFPTQRPVLWAGDFEPQHFDGSAAQAIRAAGGQGWLCSFPQATPAAIADARRCGLQFGVWTVNEPEDMRAMMQLGADAIITDRPDRMASLQKSG